MASVGWFSSVFDRNRLRLILKTSSIWYLALLRNLSCNTLWLDPMLKFRGLSPCERQTLLGISDVLLQLASESCSPPYGPWCYGTEIAVPIDESCSDAGVRDAVLWHARSQDFESARAAPISFVAFGGKGVRGEASLSPQWVWGRRFCESTILFMRFGIANDDLWWSQLGSDSDNWRYQAASNRWLKFELCAWARLHYILKLWPNA